MAKLTLSDLTSLTNEQSALTSLAANNNLIETAVEKTLSRDGTTPNSMSADLDMDSNSIINLPDPVDDDEPVTLGFATTNYGDALGYSVAAAASATSASSSATSAATSATAASTSATAAATSATASATSATAAASSATSASSSATSATSSASTATTQATNAASSATSASSSATSATSSASTATTQASNASTSATNAATSATNAASSATSASTSATAAAASATSTNKSGLNYIYLTGTSMADPSAGNLRLNNATLSSVTSVAMSVNTNDSGNPSVRNFLTKWDDSTSTIKSFIIFRKASAPENFAIYTESVALTDNTTWVQIPLNYVTHSGSFSNSDALIVYHERTGDAGSGTISGMVQYGIPVANDATTIAASIPPVTGGLLNSTSTSVNPAFSATPILGASGTLGSLEFGNATSGTIKIQPVTGALSTVTLSLPAATDTLVGKATTDTLTNKTLTSPVLTTPTLGTPGSGTLTNCTGLPVAGITASTSTALGVGSVELGHASDTTIARVSAGVASLEGSNLLTVASGGALTAGFTSASVSAGTKSSGTYTFDPTVGSVQHYTNGGAHTLAPPATHGAWTLDVTNNGSAGTVTISGWTKADGDAFNTDTTNAHAHRLFLSVGNLGSYISAKRMV